MKIFDIVKDGGALLIRSTDSQNEYSIPIGAGVKNRIDYGIDWIDIYSGDNVIWSGLATSILSVGGAPSPLDVTDLVAAISSEIALISGGNIQSEIDLLQGTIDEAFARIVTVENRPVGNSGEGKRYFISTPATAGIYAATETFTGSPTTITKTFTNVYQTIVEAETDALNITVIPSGNWNTDISFTHTNGKDFTAKLSFYDDTTLLEEIESDILPGTEKIVLSKTFQTFGFTSGNKLKLKLEAKSNHNGDISVYTNDGTKDLHIHTPILIDVVNSAVQNALNLMQNKIVQVASQSAMLALTGKSVGDIVSRTDDNNYLYNLTALPASSLSNWEVIGKDAQPVGETVEDIITTNEVITSKVNGLYAFTGTPNGGFPAGVTQGDIAQKTASVWTVVYTFINAPAAIFANSDGKTYFKTINGANINTWQAKSEPSVYEVGPDKQYTTLQSAVDAYQADFTANKLSVGVIFIYQTLINENVIIGGTADIQNLMVEGYGVQGSSNVQITKLTLGGFSHRIKLKNLMFSNTTLNPPLNIESTGTCTENGVPNIPRGKHFLDNVTLSTPHTTSFNVTSCDNFLNLNKCDFGGTSKIFNISSKTGIATQVSIDGCANGLLNIGNNRIITKNNSASVYRGTISATGTIILDVDTATPIAYSILRSYSALGAPVPITLGSMIINDDVGGTLQMLKCITAYIVAGALGVGTPIDLTKYQVQTDSLKANDNAVVHLTGGETVAGLKTFSTAPNLSSLTASQRLETDASKNITSVAKNTADNKNYSTTVTDIKVNGTQSLGTLDTLPRADHIHPIDTTREATANKVSTFTATPNNTNFPSEKLVKDSLDLKQNITDNTLNTTSKTIVGGINELKTSIDGKVVDAINDGVTSTAPSQNAVFDALALKANQSTTYTKTETDTAISATIAALDVMVFKGVINASTNPNYPAGDAGHTYRISVAGKIGGASGVNVEAGDMLLCLVDATVSGNQATVGANWNISQANIDGAVISNETVTVDNDFIVFSGTTGKIIKKATLASYKTLLALVKGDVGLGNVDNTTDLNKPISIATQMALDLKQGKVYDYADTQANILSINPTANNGKTAKATNTLKEYISNGTTWAEVSGGNKLTVGAVQTANFTTLANIINPVNTTAGVVIATLPLSPTAGDIVRFTDYANTFGTNKLTLNPNGLNINGLTANIDIITNNADPEIVYIDATEGWALRISNAAGVVIPIFHAVTNAAQTFATNASIKITNFGTVITDNVNAFNPTTSQYTVATTGYYQVAASLQTNANTSSTIQLYKNGVNLLALSNNIAGQIISPGNPSPPLLLNAGDILEIYMYSNGGETTFPGKGCRWSLVMINTASHDTSTGGLILSGVKNVDFTALSNYIYPCDNTSAAITVTLPTNPAPKDTIQLIDYANKWSTNNLTINPNGKRINSFLLNIIINTNNTNPTLTYIDATQGWALQVESTDATLQTEASNKQFVLIDGVKLNGNNNILSLPTTTSLKIGGLAQTVYGKFSGQTKVIFSQDITYANAAAIPVFGLGGNTNSTNPNANLDVAIKNINSYGNGGSNINFILAINSAGTLFAIPAPNATPNSNFVDGLLDISTITSGQIGFQLNPLKAYRHNGTAIELYDFILMGQVNWNGTVFSSLINYAFNRTKKTNKGSIVASTFITDTPNIGSDMSFRYEMVCKIAQGGYQVGDKINSFVYLSSGVANIIHSSNDNNTCRIFIPGSNLSAYQKTVGVVFALTYANWDVIFYSEGNY